jgi:hypothetical protein
MHRGSDIAGLHDTRGIAPNVLGKPTGLTECEVVAIHAGRLDARAIGRRAVSISARYPLYYQPQIGDLVLVGEIQGDERQRVVLQVISTKDGLSPQTLPELATSVEHTTSFTVGLGDVGRVCDCNSSSPIVGTVPKGVFRPGYLFEFCAVGLGPFTLAAASGVTLHTPASLTTRERWSTIGLRCRLENDFIVSGDLA